MNSLVSNTINSIRFTGSLVGTCSFKVYIYDGGGYYIGSKTLPFFTFFHFFKFRAFLDLFLVKKK